MSSPAVTSQSDISLFTFSSASTSRADLIKILFPSFYLIFQQKGYDLVSLPGWNDHPHTRHQIIRQGYWNFLYKMVPSQRYVYAVCDIQKILAIVHHGFSRNYTEFSEYRPCHSCFMNEDNPLILRCMIHNWTIGAFRHSGIELGPFLLCKL